jgi:hypothetical protein
MMNPNYPLSGLKPGGRCIENGVDDFGDRQLAYISVIFHSGM